MRILMIVAALGLVGSIALAVGEGIKVEKGDESVIVRGGENEIVRYQLTNPSGVKLPVESGCFFHPMRTPAGVVVTDLAPSDHPHHRGIFIGWVEMHGKKDADFWGWGEHAPVKGRVIVSKRVDVKEIDGKGTMTFSNEWVADGQTIINEQLTAVVRSSPSANILDLEYQLTPVDDIKLSRWAFSGFCVRTLKDAKVTAVGPDGEVKLPDPSHVKPESDWPAAPWYGFALSLADGKSAGVAVIDHPGNPPSLWHNNRGVRMLNPCIVAPGDVQLKAGKPLVLRYRVVAVDGALDGAAMNKLAMEFRGK